MIRTLPTTYRASVGNVQELSLKSKSSMDDYGLRVNVLGNTVGHDRCMVRSSRTLDS